MSEDLATAAMPPPRVQTPFQRFVDDFTDSKLAVFGLVIFTIILVLAVFAPIFSPQNPYDLKQLSILDSRLPPGSEVFISFGMCPSSCRFSWTESG